MRINKFIALASGLSRRAADQAIKEDRVKINNLLPVVGQDVQSTDEVRLDDKPLQLPTAHKTIILNKPVGYVVSRNGQGSPTIYELLPKELQTLKPIGRLDKDSSGLLLLTNDGQLAQELTHPKYQKAKVYEVRLNKELTKEHSQQLTGPGIRLEDGLSRLRLEQLSSDRDWQVTINEGRNRQIRRTFANLGYQVINLKRIKFGSYQLESLGESKWQEVATQDY